MWYNNKTVIRVHSKSGSKMTWAYIDGFNSWQRILPSTVDGVTNLSIILSVAKANNRKVDVYIKNGNIEQATLR